MSVTRNRRGTLSGILASHVFGRTASRLACAPLHWPVPDMLLAWMRISTTGWSNRASCALPVPRADTNPNPSNRAKRCRRPQVQHAGSAITDGGNQMVLSRVKLSASAGGKGVCACHRETPSFHHRRRNRDPIQALHTLSQEISIRPRIIIIQPGNGLTWLQRQPPCCGREPHQPRRCSECEHAGR